MSDQGDSSPTSRLSDTQRRLLLELLNRPDLVAEFVQGLDSSEQKQAAAETAAVAVTPEAAPEHVAKVVQQLPSSEQKQEAAAAAAAEVAPEAKPELVAKVVQQLPSNEQKQAAAAAAMGQLSQADQEAVALGAGVLDLPDAITQRRLWYMVVGTMGIAIFVFGVMAFLLLNWGKPAEAPLALATTALGGIVGLVATSPGRSRRPG
jgi:hypothetical protein